MADDGKRTETISFKVTERMALDLMRLASSDDRSLSDYLYGRTRRDLYGEVVRIERAAQVTTSDKVNLEGPRE